MTRFARIPRNKGLNAKVPEAATPWSELKQQMLDKPRKRQVENSSSEEEDVNKSVEAGTTRTSSNLITNFKVRTTWCDFEEENEEKNNSYTKKRKSVNYEQDNDEDVTNLTKKQKKHEIIENEGYNELNDQNIKGKLNRLPKKKKKKDKVKDEIVVSDEGSSEDKVRLPRKMKKRHKVESVNEFEEGSVSNEEKVGRLPSKRKRKKHDLENGNEVDELLTDSVITEQSRKQKNKAFIDEINDTGGQDKHPKDTSIVLDGKAIQIVKFDGFYILETDAERIQKIRENLEKKRLPKKDIEGIIRRHRRNAEKLLGKKKKNICFHCREGIHNLSECPKLGNEEAIITGICYKCGSTEHLLYQCKASGNELKFAKCFICNEIGHLSKQCPDNPRGLYPHGGSCRMCGDVTHLKKDCPQLVRERRRNTITVGTIGNSVECLEESKGKISKPLTNCKKVNKIIKFH